LKQTDHSALSINPLADGAGHTFFEQSVFEGEIGQGQPLAARMITSLPLSPAGMGFRNWT
jgi:hypothetical protein